MSSDTHSEKYALPISPRQVQRIRLNLLEWYDQVKRALPWRENQDPYRIWVSEIMLQQTRVDTVIPYYNRFLQRFETLESLANAHEDDVLKLWSGLGYYRRARLLHTGAKQAFAQYGRVPKSASERLALPGIGKYTSGAIGSIAFGLEEPIVDGNVTRVFSRLFLLDEPMPHAATEKRLWSYASVFAKGERPGDLNQALMELGATICTKHQPACKRCPIRKGCRARKKGMQHILPRPKKKTPLKVLEAISVICRSPRKKVWLVRGSSRGDVGQLYQDLWNLPTILFSTISDYHASSAYRVLDAYGLDAKDSLLPVGRLEHTLTHRKINVHVFQADDCRGKVSSTLRRFSHDVIMANAEVGVSSLTRKILGRQEID